MTFPIARTADYASLVDDSRPHRRRRVAAPVLRGAVGCRARRLVASRDDRRRALPQHPRRRLRRGRLPSQPQAASRSRACADTARSSELPDPVDLAVVCVPAAAVLESVSSALEHGIRAVCVISAGFAEVGSEGEERQRDLLALVRAHGARLLGPNCLGISSAAVRLNATFASRSAPPGNIGFSSQSGALGLALLEACESRGLGLSAFVSIGNKADVSSNDLLEWWEDDPATEVVLLYLESFGNPRRFGTTRSPRSANEAHSRGQERNDRCRRACRKLTHRGAGRLGGRGRRALPSGGSHPGTLARGARRRRSTASRRSRCLEVDASQS